VAIGVSEEQLSSVTTQLELVQSFQTRKVMEIRQYLRVWIDEEVVIGKRGVEASKISD
jgi:hypothetical protein